MKLYDFRLILDAEPDDDGVDRLAEFIDDGTIGTINGVPEIWFGRESGSFEQAFQSAISDVRKAGFDFVRVEIDKASIPETETAAA